MSLRSGITSSVSPPSILPSATAISTCIGSRQRKAPQKTRRRRSSLLLCPRNRDGNNWFELCLASRPLASELQREHEVIAPLRLSLVLIRASAQSPIRARDVTPDRSKRNSSDST